MSSRKTQFTLWQLERQLGLADKSIANEISRLNCDLHSCTSEGHKSAPSSRYYHANQQSATRRYDVRSIVNFSAHLNVSETVFRPRIQDGPVFSLLRRSTPDSRHEVDGTFLKRPSSTQKACRQVEDQNCAFQFSTFNDQCFRNTLAIVWHHSLRELQCSFCRNYRPPTVTSVSSPNPSIPKPCPERTGTTCQLNHRRVQHTSSSSNSTKFKSRKQPFSTFVTPHRDPPSW